MKKLKLIISLVSLITCRAGQGAAFQSPAKSFYLLDFQSGQAIAAKAEDDLMIPSSMVKLMTAELVFGALRDGKISLSTKLPVSKSADYRNPVLSGASKVCLSEGQTITVHDAISGMITVSGADAAIVLAEKLAPNEAAFTEMMTRRAREIGMEYSSFGNASGLPDVNNLSTSKELAILAEHIIRTYPEYTHFFKTRRFEFVDPQSDFCRNWAKTRAISYNRLLFIMGGAEGLKTGHTVKGGYGVVAAAIRKNRRLIAIINGFSAKGHDPLAAEAKRILEYGFDNTFNREIKTDVSVPVWYGRKDKVRLQPDKPFVLTFHNGTNLDNLRITAVIPATIAAPVKEGDEIGRVKATLDGREIKSTPLYATEDIRRVRFFGRVFRNIKYFLTGQ